MAIRKEKAATGDPTAEETTVLFVDDESDLLQTYDSLFGTDNEVVTATGGEEAVEQFDEDIDVAFLDRRMPGLTGEETIRRLREQGYQTPLVVVSGIEPDEGGSGEYDAYLRKPVGIEEVQSTIDRFVD